MIPNSDYGKDNDNGNIYIILLLFLALRIYKECQASQIKYSVLKDY